MLFNAGRDLGLPVLQGARFSVVLILRNPPRLDAAVAERCF
jgi:hypothetical protein